MSMEMPVIKSIPFCIEEGTFQHFVLSDGTMKYCSKDHKLIATVIVISGRKQNDPIVHFKDLLLEQIFTQNELVDLNHNRKIRGFFVKRDSNQKWQRVIKLNRTWPLQKP